MQFESSGDGACLAVGAAGSALALWGWFGASLGFVEVR